MVQQNGGVETEWVDIMWQFQALADPAAALAKFGSGNYSPEGGESKAHTYHWLHNLNVMGQLDTDVTGNVPTYAVFNDAGTRTYVGYNASAAPITINYSDGMCLDVAAGALDAGPGYTCGSPITPTPTSTPTPVTPTSTPTMTPTPGGPTATPTPTAPPPVSTEFTATANYVDATNAQIVFVPAETVAWVDLHYIVDGGGQLNVRMIEDANGNWTWDVGNLADGSVVEYGFTYFTTFGINSAKVTYEHSATVTPPLAVGLGTADTTQSLPILYILLGTLLSTSIFVCFAQHSWHSSIVKSQFTCSINRQ